MTRHLRNPFYAVVLILSVLLAGFLAFKNVQSGFMPKMDKGGFIVDYRALPGLNGAKTRKIWGSLLPRRGYRILAQGFNPGNRPPGRRALKGRQVIVTSNRLEKRIYIGPAIVQLCAGAHC